VILGEGWARAGELERARRLWSEGAGALASLAGRSQDRQLLVPLSRALLLLGRSEEARQVLATLGRSGYRHRSLAEFSRARGFSLS
jgi:hypothetical protein